MGAFDLHKMCIRDSDKIVALMGDLPRVELFARQTSPGWDVWGNEVEPTIPDFGTNCPKLEVTD